MTKQVRDPSSREWTVRRSVVRGRDGAGHRWRWRGPSWLKDLTGLIQIGDLADIPVIGIVFGVIALAVLAVVIVVLLPFLVIGLLEALILALVVTVGAAAATLAGRPLLIRAETGSTHLVWAVRGWRRSKEVRDEVVAAIEAGQDLRAPGRVDGELVYDAEAAAPPPGPVA